MVAEECCQDKQQMDKNSLTRTTKQKYKILSSFFMNVRVQKQDYIFYFFFVFLEEEFLSLCCFERICDKAS